MIFILFFFSWKKNPDFPSMIDSIAIISQEETLPANNITFNKLVVFANNYFTSCNFFSGMRDSNSRPLGPKPSTLAIWANPRTEHFNGAKRQNWTADTRLFRPLLYHWATLALHFVRTFTFPLNRMDIKIWWAWMDSNHRPHPYQRCALTAWATRPYPFQIFMLVFYRYLGRNFKRFFLFLFPRIFSHKISLFKEPP